MSNDVNLDVFLQGGHNIRLSLSQEDPMLVALVQAATQQVAAGAEAVFNIRSSERQGIIFRSQNVVALVSDPPILFERVEAASTVGMDGMPESYAAEAKKPCFVLKNFLKPDEHRALLDYVNARQADFEPTKAGGEFMSSYRNSKVLYHFGHFQTLLVERVTQAMPEAMRYFGIPQKPIDRVEAQLTAHGDGDFYRLHTDNSSEDTASRELTFVYYFNRSPKRYKGGELRLYNSMTVHNTTDEAHDQFMLVPPDDNSIVFFPSERMHEVLPITILGAHDFMDYRFTINGWLRQVK